jgi:hypothetical protein
MEWMSLWNSSEALNDCLHCGCMHISRASPLETCQQDSGNHSVRWVEYGTQGDSRLLGGGLCTWHGGSSGVVVTAIAGDSQTIARAVQIGGGQGRPARVFTLQSAGQVVQRPVAVAVVAVGVCHL